jgi:hypothetical protein
MYNLMVTTFSLVLLWISSTQVTRPVPSKSADQTVQQFWSLELSGARLTETGWIQTNAFFLRPIPWSPNQPLIVVSDKYLIDKIGQSPTSADVYVGCNALGSVDSELRFKPSEAGGPLTKMVCKFSVALNETKDWKIVNAPTGRRIGVDAAIRYVSEMLRKTSDAQIRTNAQRTVAALKALRGTA